MFRLPGSMVYIKLARGIVVIESSCIAELTAASLSKIQEVEAASKEALSTPKRWVKSYLGKVFAVRKACQTSI